MQADALTPGRPHFGAGARALAVAAAVVTLATPTAAQEQAAGAHARVPTSYANVHDAPSTGSNLLLLVPEGAVLSIIGRRGEWVQVQVSPGLRETGMIVRWYEGRHEIIRRGERVVIGDEDNGWMHDSTVEILPVGAQ
jgi:hypothetical protein